MRVDDDPIRDAMRDWNALTPGERREVDREARHGRLHTEQKVADISVRWARAVLTRQQDRDVVTRFFAAGRGGGGDAAVSDLRLAQKLVKIADRSN